MTLVKASKVTVDFLCKSSVMVSDSSQKECLTGVCSACTLGRAVACSSGSTEEGNGDKVHTVQLELWGKRGSITRHMAAVPFLKACLVPEGA